MRDVYYTGHAKARMAERGVTEEEITEILQTGEPAQREGSREIRSKVFTAGYSWRGRYYPHKEVRVVSIENEGTIVVITVIARYGRWEGNS